MTNIFIFESPPNTKPKEKNWGAHGILCLPRLKKWGRHVPRVSHQIAPMSAGATFRQTWRMHRALGQRGAKTKYITMWF